MSEDNNEYSLAFKKIQKRKMKNAEDYVDAFVSTTESLGWKISITNLKHLLKENPLSLEDQIDFVLALKNHKATREKLSHKQIDKITLKMGKELMKQKTEGVKTVKVNPIDKPVKKEKKVKGKKVVKSTKTSGGLDDEENNNGMNDVMDELMDELMLGTGLQQEQIHSSMPVKRTPEGKLEEILYESPVQVEKKSKKVGKQKGQKKEVKSEGNETLPTSKILLESTDLTGFKEWTEEKQMLAVLNISWAYLRENSKIDEDGELTDKDFLLEYALWNIRANWARDKNVDEKKATKHMKKLFSLFINTNKDFHMLYKDMKKDNYAPVPLKRLQTMYSI